MKFLSLILVYMAIHSMANAQQLQPLVQSQVPTIDMVDVYLDHGVLPYTIVDSVSLKVWTLANEPEAIDGSLAGQMYIGLEHEIEGSPTDIFKLPIKDALSIVDVIYRINLVEVDGKPTTVLTEVTILYKAIDWRNPSVHLEKRAIIAIKYSEFGYIDGIEYLK